MYAAASRRCGLPKNNGNFSALKIAGQLSVTKRNGSRLVRYHDRVMSEGL
jgi:hypothetical protein